MWLIRLWFLFAAAAAALAVGAAMLATAPADRDRTAAYGYKLDLVQHNAQLLLKLDQRENIDVVARMSRDPRIVDTLSAVGGGRTTAEAGQADANAAMLDLLAQIPADARPELCIVVDERGKLLVRIGQGEGTSPPLKEGLIGYPLVSSALRGMLRDDTWSLDGKLYLMAAAPIVARGADRYLGALLIGQEITVAYAERLKERLVATHVPYLAQTDISFFLRGSQIATTIDDEPLKKLPRQFAKHREEYLKAERSAPLRLAQGDSAHLVVMAPLAGQAAAHDAFYAVVTPDPPPIGLVATLQRATTRDLMRPEVLGAVGGTFLVIVIFGWLLLFARLSAPLGRLIRDLRRLARGELVRLPLHTYGRSYNTIAEVVCEAIDRGSKRGSAGASPRASAGVAQPHDSRPVGIDLDPKPAQQSAGAPPLAPGSVAVDKSAGPQTMGGVVALAAGPAAEPLPPLAAPPAPAAPPMAPPSSEMRLRGEDINPIPAPPPPLSLDSAEDAVTDHRRARARHASKPSEPPEDFGADLPLLKPIELPDDESAAEGDTIAEAGPSGSTTWSASDDAVSLYDDAPSDGITNRTPSSESGARASDRPPSLDEERDTVMSSVPEHLARSIKDRTPTPAIEATDPSELETEQFDNHIQKIFKEFVSIKRSCGEETDKLTYERFAAKLRKNRDALMGKYDCTSVRFKVYVKDGKAALKATPVSEES
jgi:hypothetical protein